MDHANLFLYSLLQHGQLLEEGSVLCKQVESLFSDLSEVKCKMYEKLLKKAGRYTLWKSNTKQWGDHVMALLPQLGRRNAEWYYAHHPLNIHQSVGVPIVGNHTNRLHLQKTLIEKISIVLRQSSNKATQVYHLLQQYGWCLPNGHGAAFLSLFDYLKSRAAFAQCLVYDTMQNPYPFLLVCGDLAGIQSFIYDIHSNKAAKSLKGRSFYLQYLLDYILHRIVLQCEMTEANIIYMSGGKFFLLLPNIPSIRAVLQRVEEEAMRYIFEHYGDRLYCCLGSVPFGIQEEEGVLEICSPEQTSEGKPIQSFGQLWAATAAKAGYKKTRRLLPLIGKEPSYFQRLFRGESEEVYNGNEVEVCAVTGAPIQRSQAKDLRWVDTPLPHAARLNNIGEEMEEDPIYVTPAVYTQVELGYRLIRHPYYTLHLQQIKEGLFDPKKGIQLTKQASLRNDERSYLLNPKEDGFRLPKFYGGDQQAVYIDQRDGYDRLRIKNYEELAAPDQGEVETRSFNKLAVLRMDVDDLGLLFKKKLKQYDYTPAAYGHLSQMLHWFFAGHLNWIREQSDTTPNSGKNYINHLNIQYAGGDDLLVVGRWKEVLCFARDVQYSFKTFTQDKLKISGGMVQVRPKFPISKAVWLAEEGLDRAKSSKGKNAFCFEDYVVRWGAEFDFVWKLYQLLEQHLPQLGKGLLYKLLAYRKQFKEGRIEWYWQSAYMFQKHQNYAKQKQQLEGAALLKAMKEALVAGVFSYTSAKKETTLNYKDIRPGRLLELCCLAAIWSDYSTR